MKILIVNDQNEVLETFRDKDSESWEGLLEDLERDANLFVKRGELTIKFAEDE